MEACLQSSELLNDGLVDQVTAQIDLDVVDSVPDPDKPNPDPWSGQECSNNASSLEMHESVVGDVKPKLISKSENSGASELQCETGQGDKPEEIKEQKLPDVNDEETCTTPAEPIEQSETGMSANNDSSCNESPGVASLDDTDDTEDYIETAADERIACIEEEYIQRIAVLEERHNELEDVLSRLTVAIECGIAQQCAAEKFKAPSHDIEHDGEVAEAEEVAGACAKDEPDAKPLEVGDDQPNPAIHKVGHTVLLDMFLEFQHKIRQFAEDLNGVLNCSEAAIRHARVVQEWATSVQIMFEQIKEERHKILNYIDERERNMLVVKEQFIAELEEQGKQLKQLVADMMSYREMREDGENYCKTVEESSHRRSTVERVVDMLLKKRLEEDRSIVLGLSRQSKISEMKLFIIHQQSCIQQLQEQNRELRAIIEGLMGPDYEDEELTEDSQTSGTPASDGTGSPIVCPVRETLDRQDSPLVSQVSEVLYCDRGEYLPGKSTDGDLATIQAYGIGKQSEQIESGENVVFDPLSVNYVREQCQQAEETERLAHAAINKGSELNDEQTPPVEPVVDETESLKQKIQDVHISDTEDKEINTADQKYINDIAKEYETPRESGQDGESPQNDSEHCETSPSTENVNVGSEA